MFKLGARGFRISGMGIWLYGRGLMVEDLRFEAGKRICKGSRSRTYD